MKIKLWEVEFGNWTTTTVKAPNAKCAMETAIKNRKKKHDNYLNRVQDITKVDFIAEED